MIWFDNMHCSNTKHLRNLVKRFNWKPLDWNNFHHLLLFSLDPIFSNFLNCSWDEGIMSKLVSWINLALENKFGFRKKYLQVGKHDMATVFFSMTRASYKHNSSTKDDSGIYSVHSFNCVKTAHRFCIALLELLSGNCFCCHKLDVAIKEFRGFGAIFCL